MPKSHGEVKSINGKRVATPEYRAWQSMKGRCLNPTDKNYRYYGGRGIAVFPEWVASYEAFLRDVGRRPADNLTLDRIDVNKGYEPDNCRWATRETQARNRAYATVRAWEIAEALGLSVKTVYHMMWECREKDKGRLRHFTLSPENEARIRAYMKG